MTLKRVARELSVLIGVSLTLGSSAHAGLFDFLLKKKPTTTASPACVEVLTEKPRRQIEPDQKVIENISALNLANQFDNEAVMALATYIDGQLLELSASVHYDENFSAILDRVTQDFSGVSIMTSGTMTLSSRPSTQIMFRINSVASRTAFFAALTKYPDFHFFGAYLLRDGKIWDRVTGRMRNP